MIVQLTNAGAALLNANTGPIQLSSFKLGDAFGYIPAPTDTNIHGNLVYTGGVSPYYVVNANVVKYSAYLDYNLGPFAFGEIGIFTSTGVLFALASASALIQKFASSEKTGNAIRLDIYLSMVGTNYAMWLDSAESNNEFQVAILGSVDQLPPSPQATPNEYIISGLSAQQSSFFAYTDRTGLWAFDAYAYAGQSQAQITAFDSRSVTIALSQYSPQTNPGYLGQVILEFVTGNLYSICRYVSSAVTSGNSVTFGFDNPLMMLPSVGDTVALFVRQVLTTTIPVPIASHTSLGGVIVGNTLTVDGTGLINVDYTKVPYAVTSVAGRTGAVVLSYTDISGLATVAHSGSYTDLINTPAPYALPIASTSVLGGVKAPLTGNITISASGVIDLGFSPVTSVAGRTGAVVLTAADISGLATVATSGSYNDLTNKPAPYSLPIATANVLGGIKVGSGLSVAGDGTLSTSGGGSVVSVGLALPAEFSVTGSPVTGSGTLTGAWANQNPGYVFASPAVGGGATAGTPSFKQLSLGASVNNAWNAADMSTHFTLSNGGLQVNLASAPANFSLVRGTQSHNSGKWVFEWTCPAHVTNVQGGGIATAQDGVDAGLLPGQDDTSGSFLRGDQLVTAGHANVSCAITQTPAGAVIMVAVDIGAGLIWFRKNNGNWNASVSANPATGVGGIAITAALAYYPMFMFAFNSTVGDSSLLNVGATAFTNSVPAGFQQWNALDTRNAVPIDTNIQVPATNDVIYFANGKWTNGPISLLSPSYTLPVATASTLGGVKQGSGVNIAGDGTLSVSSGPAVAADIVSYTFFGGL